MIKKNEPFIISIFRCLLTFRVHFNLEVTLRFKAILVATHTKKRSKKQNKKDFNFNHKK